MAFCRWSCRHEFLLRQWQRVKKGLQRGLAEAPAALMGPLLVVFGDPRIKVGLQLVDGAIDLLAKCHPVELIQDGAMKALADAIGLRALGLGAAVIDVLDREVEFVFVALGAAKLGAAIGQHARQPDRVLIVKRHHPVVEDLGRGDRRLAVIELGEGDFGIGVDHGLLIDPADPLQGADIKGVLGAAITRAFAVELAMGFLVGLGRSWRCHTQRTPAGEIDRPRRFSISETRTWPQAGCSVAIATTACSMSGAVRFFNTGLRRLISCKASSPPLSYSSLNR